MEMTAMEQAVALLLHDYRMRKKKSRKRTYRADRLLAEIEGDGTPQAEAAPQAAEESLRGAYEDAMAKVQRLEAELSVARGRAAQQTMLAAALESELEDAKAEHADELDTLRARLSAAERDRDTWHKHYKAMCEGAV